MQNSIIKNSQKASWKTRGDTEKQLRKIFMSVWNCSRHKVCGAGLTDCYPLCCAFSIPAVAF